MYCYRYVSWGLYFINFQYNLSFAFHLCIRFRLFEKYIRLFCLGDALDIFIVYDMISNLFLVLCLFFLVRPVPSLLVTTVLSLFFSFEIHHHGNLLFVFSLIQQYSYSIVYNCCRQYYRSGVTFPDFRISFISLLQIYNTFY